jgi:hypothetical protein
LCDEEKSISWGVRNVDELETARTPSVTEFELGFLSLPFNS